MENIKLNERLFAAVETDNLINVRILLEQGADPTAFTSGGQNAIGLAASLGDATILARLLYAAHNSVVPAEKSFEDDWPIPFDNTPEELCDLQWDDEIDSKQIFSPDKEWLDLYSYYARMWENIGHVLDTANELRDIHCLDRRNQMAPLHYAAKMGHLVCVRLLIDDFKCPVDVSMPSGQTALHLACEFQHHRVVKYLLQSGAEIDKKTVKVEDTPLLKASKSGNATIVRLLLEAGADVNACNAYDVTALIGATIFGNVDTVMVLLEHGANVNLRDRDGLTALVIAVHNGTTTIVTALLANGAKVLPTENLLHTAINLPDDLIARQLISVAGESVYRGRDSFGLTPFERILQQGNVSLMYYGHERCTNNCAMEPHRELLMALHCPDEWIFSEMLAFLLFTTPRHQETEQLVLISSIRLRHFGHAKALIRANLRTQGENNSDLVDILRRIVPHQLDVAEYLINGGFNVHQNLKGLSIDADSATIMDQYLLSVAANPLSLQQLIRIRLRGILRDAESRFLSNHHQCLVNVPCDAVRMTPVEAMLRTIPLPPLLHDYILNFPDLGS